MHVQRRKKRERDHTHSEENEETGPEVIKGKVNGSTAKAEERPRRCVQTHRHMPHARILEQCACIEAVGTAA
jgi:hypothetical protein